MLRATLIGLLLGNAVVYSQLVITLAQFSEAATLKAIHRAEPKAKPVTVINKDGADYIPLPDKPPPSFDFAWRPQPQWI